MERAINDGNICLFGPALAQARKQAGIAQSRLGMRVACNPANMKLIEEGVVQPGVVLAVRLVYLTGYGIMAFFDQLAQPVGYEMASAHANDDDKSALQTMLTRIIDTNGTTPIAPKAMYGKLLREIRLANGITQMTVAKAANYNLRNILNVETKGQEPGIMTAIALVAATGCPVGIFFEVLSQYLKEISSG